jgi:hypothetical protein
VAHTRVGEADGRVAEGGEAAHPPGRGERAERAGVRIREHMSRRPSVCCSPDPPRGREPGPFSLRGPFCGAAGPLPVFVAVDRTFLLLLLLL